jgi:alkylated DNA nucleotide flippase Atl1
MVAARAPNVVLSSKPRRSAAAGGGTRTRRASWQAKLRPELAPRVIEDTRRGGLLLLPTPLLIGEAIAAIPSGRVLTLGALRDALARQFGADRTCPLLTGMFATILAGAVADDLVQRRQPRWPVWRLVRDDGTLPPRWPLDARYRATLLRQEGVRLTHRNGHWAAIDTHDP